MKLLNAAILLLLLTACGGQGEWEDDNRNAEDEEAFILSYLDDWEESLESGSFSYMEPYYILNNHGYHNERRYHQQLVSSRTIERVAAVEETVPEVNEYEEERIRMTITYEIEEGGAVTEETRTRFFYLGEDDGEPVIEAIGRRSDEDE
ncbi:hypothetical protein [Alkalicoccus chagannorensis]|uniref:hypothetical protein n=1 Tax=Alkalicoccus chagannorensis TaxID=427072 RepID=UPI00040A7FF3|nr:hypothetical protein [Alkalicoccus chagannorensis]